MQSNPSGSLQAPTLRASKFFPEASGSRLSLQSPARALNSAEPELEPGACSSHGAGPSLCGREASPSPPPTPRSPGTARPSPKPSPPCAPAAGNSGTVAPARAGSFGAAARHETPQFRPSSAVSEARRAARVPPAHPVFRRHREEALLTNTLQTDLLRLQVWLRHAQRWPRLLCAQAQTRTAPRRVRESSFPGFLSLPTVTKRRSRGSALGAPPQGPAPTAAVRALF